MKPHIRIRGVGGKHAYDGLYGAMCTIKRGNALILQCTSKLTSLVSLHANLNKKKAPLVL
jgi:hypothetical protein